MVRQNQLSVKDVPSWLPDWRDPTQYPTANELSYLKWAWEFLRRNPDYQKDFELFKELRAAEDRHSESPQPLIQVEKQIQTLLFKHHLENYMPDPAKPAKNFGLSGLHFMGDRFPRSRGFNPAATVEASYNQEKRCIEYVCNLQPSIPLTETQVVVTFDLNLPLAPQLNKLHYSLSGRQEQLRNDNKLSMPQSPTKRSLYPRLLRILDARARGVTPKTIREVLYSDPLEYQDPVQACTYHRDLANALMSGGYQHLPLYRFSKAPTWGSSKQP